MVLPASRASNLPVPDRWMVELGVYPQILYNLQMHTDCNLRFSEAVYIVLNTALSTCTHKTSNMNLKCVPALHSSWCSFAHCFSPSQVRSLLRCPDFILNNCCPSIGYMYVGLPLSKSQTGCDPPQSWWGQWWPAWYDLPCCLDPIGSFLAGWFSASVVCQVLDGDPACPG